MNGGNLPTNRLYDINWGAQGALLCVCVSQVKRMVYHSCHSPMITVVCLLVTINIVSAHRSFIKVYHFLIVIVGARVMQTVKLKNYRRCWVQKFQFMDHHVLDTLYINLLAWCTMRILS